jgi:hypothetical protein
VDQPFATEPVAEGIGMRRIREIEPNVPLSFVDMPTTPLGLMSWLLWIYVGRLSFPSGKLRPQQLRSTEE